MQGTEKELRGSELCNPVSLSGVRGHEEDRQRQGNGVRLPPAAGVPDPAGRGARQGALLRQGGNC